MAPISPDPEQAERAIQTVKEALPLMTLGPPLEHGPPHDRHVDFPLMYQGYALDRIHFDPEKGRPSPKGLPVRSSLPPTSEIPKLELRVLEAAEYREPERCWAVPLAWGPFIVAHVKVTHDGKEIIPDYPLTEEVRRHVL